ncbi:MAG: ABC transporter permease [Gemmatimonadota bacterium]|nr:ABC transporter permease [Gemmatimonadota bacterium]
MADVQAQSVRSVGALESILTGAVAVALTLLTGAVLLLLGGFDPIAAGGAMIGGAFGGWNTFVSITLVRSIPLILTGLAVALAFRAGVWNIGAEGQLYAGAIAAVWVGIRGGALPAPLLVPAVLMSAGVAGALWALVPTLMHLRLGVGEVITTILMNFVGIYLAAYMVHGPLQEARGVFPQTGPIAEAARLPMLLPGSRLHWGFGVALLLAAALAVVVRRTRFGFELRAVGASPEAAAVSGRIDTSRVLLVSFLGSGAIAGLAGGVEISGLTHALYEDLSPGWGYTAIAVALLAGLNPAGVVVTGVLFGALQAGAGAMQRDAGIPAAWVGVVEALVILAVLAIDRIRRRAGALRAAGARGDE